MKIFLDDIRRVDEELGYNVVRTYEECIEAIESKPNEVSFISLDYSLGTEETGYDVLVYMADHKVHPNHINIHSDHTYGVPLMKKYIEDNFDKKTIVTFNKV